MKRIFISVLTALALSACASGPTAYGPAKNYDSVGYKNTRIQSDRFRVSYTANNAAHTSVGIGVGLNDVVGALEGERVTNAIEIRLLKTGGNSNDIYDAKSITNSIRPAIFSNYG